jgi:zinc protease
MLDEGTTSLDALEISDALARLGARLSSASNVDISTITLSALKENLDASLDIYADVILNPLFAPEELERLRLLQLANIQQEKNAPEEMALRVIPRLLYGDEHAYSLPLTGSGTEEAVAAMTRDDLLKFHETWFKPNNATMIVVGDTTLAEVQPKLEALFSSWPRGTVPQKTLPEVSLPETSRVFLVDRPGAPQSVVIAGQLIGPKRESDDIAIDTMNDVLGGSFTSRINMNLREDKAWSYGAQTMILDTMAQRPFIAFAPVQTDQTAPSMQEIFREIEEFAGARGATEQEVATSKRRSTLTLPGRWETARSVARDIQDIVRFALPDDYWQHYAELVERTTVSEVNAAARVLSPRQLTWVIVGDLSAIEKEVRALDLGDVRVLDADGNSLETP